MWKILEFLKFAELPLYSEVRNLFKTAKITRIHGY